MGPGKDAEQAVPPLARTLNSVHNCEALSFKQVQVALHARLTAMGSTVLSLCCSRKKSRRDSDNSLHNRFVFQISAAPGDIGVDDFETYCLANSKVLSLTRCK